MYNIAVAISMQMSTSAWLIGPQSLTRKTIIQHGWKEFATNLRVEFSFGHPVP